MSIEKVWKTEAGHKAVCILTRGSHRCGYVGVPEGHPLYGKDYGESLACFKPLPEDEPLGDRSPLVILKGAISEETNSMDIVFDVHGGVTYSGHLVSPRHSDSGELSDWGKLAVEAGLEDGLWYIGFDCAHSGDGIMGEFGSDYGPVRSVEYVTEHCERLSKQIIERVIYK